MIRAKNLLIAAAASCLLGGPAVAQEQPAFPGPEKEHQFLKKFVGQWMTKSKGSAGPDEPAVECRGTMQSKMLGEFWIVNRMENEVQEFTMHGLQTIGYDPAKKKYVGVWVDSMFNHMWIYEGVVDESGNKLILEAEGPNFMAGGKLAKFRDSYEFKSPDHIIVGSSMLSDDGEWVTFMTGECRKKASDDK